MVRKAVSTERFLERSQSIQDLSIEFVLWRLVYATLALVILNCMGASDAHAARHPQDSATPDAAASQSGVASRYGQVPLSFEPNVGQSDGNVQFLSRGSGYSLFLTPREAVLSIKRTTSEAMAPAIATADHEAPAPIDILRMQLLGANATAEATGLEPRPGVTNYFIGNDPGKWHTGIPTYGKVNYRGIYPGIDLVFYGNQRQLEYDFVVRPGGKPEGIAWFFPGARPRLDKDGSLELSTPGSASGGAVQFLAPVAYQIMDGKRLPVAVTYAVADETVRFALGPYDRSQTLVIDPTLSYFSYLGGTGDDFIGNRSPGSAGSAGPEPTEAVGIDAQDNLYVAGGTTSTDFPVAGAALPKTTKGAGQIWAFVSKFSPDGSKLLYSTYFGGTAGGNDVAYALAVDSTGNAYVTGSAGTNDFPVTKGAFQTVCAPHHSNITGLEVPGCTLDGGGNYSESAFVLKLNPTGSTLLYSSFLGGFGSTWGTESPLTPRAGRTSPAPRAPTSAEATYTPTALNTSAFPPRRTPRFQI